MRGHVFMSHRAAMLMVTWLVACAANTDELSQWMAQQRETIRPTVAPLSPPARFLPQPYAGEAAADPFSQQKLAIALKQEAKQPSSVLASELNRRKEPLEAFPLDTMTMVGSVLKHGRHTALVRVDSLLYSVKVGDRLGQNYGQITQISETDMKLREIVQDAVGEWIERPATLHLKEQGQ